MLPSGLLPIMVNLSGLRMLLIGFLALLKMNWICQVHLINENLELSSFQKKKKIKSNQITQGFPYREDCD